MCSSDLRRDAECGDNAPAESFVKMLVLHISVTPITFKEFSASWKRTNTTRTSARKLRGSFEEEVEESVLRNKLRDEPTAAEPNDGRAASA